MKNIVNSYVRKFKEDRRRSRKALALLLTLALVVAGGVTWQLHSTGIALSNETFCGMEEHQHSEDCYETVLICGLEETDGHTHDESCYETRTTLICGSEESDGHTHDESCYDEEGNLICGMEESDGHTHSDACYETEQVLICDLEESNGHTHTDDCYEKQLTCGLEEHTHTIDCLVDETADVETSADWEATIPSKSGVWAADLVSVSSSQLGYTESTANFTLADDGTTRKGYTRYGAWYGNKYGDWNSMFVSFCLNYAGIPQSYISQASGAYAWTVSMSSSDYYTTDSDYTPSAGDIVFLDLDGNGVADTTAIVSSVSGNSMTVIEGDSNSKVEKNTYSISGAYAFIDVTAAYEDYAGINSEAEDVEDAEDAKVADETDDVAEAENEESAENITGEDTESELAEDAATGEESNEITELGTETLENSIIDGVSETGTEIYITVYDENLDILDVDVSELLNKVIAGETINFKETLDLSGAGYEFDQAAIAYELTDEEDIENVENDEKAISDTITGVTSITSEADIYVVATENGEQKLTNVQTLAIVLIYEKVGEEDSEIEAEVASEIEEITGAVSYSGSDGGVTVTVTAPEGALPENAELSVTLYEEGSSEYESAAEAIGYDTTESESVAATVNEDSEASEATEEKEETTATSGLAVLDISFLVDGEKVEPSEAVTVSIDASNILPEEADASTIEVQHLDESGSSVEPVLVADASADTAGTVDVETATVEFEVESFSTFTLRWSYTDKGSTSYASVSVNVYDVDGNGIDGYTTTMTVDAGTTETLSTLLTVAGYDFDHADITYTTGGGDNQRTNTISDVVSITYSRNGNDGSYSVVTGSGSQTLNNNANNITINLYYKISEPAVVISAVGSDEEGYTLMATPSNFSGTPEYEWSIVDEEEERKATLTYDSEGNPVVTWSEDAEIGDTVTVQVKAGYTDEDGNTESAANTYTLTYGSVFLTVNVTYNSSTKATGATVTLKDADGNEVDTGTTDSDGRVVFSVTNATTYTISVSYAISSSVTLSGSSTVLVNGATTESINLSSSASSGSSVLGSTRFGHIDVKTTGATTEDSTDNETLSSVSSVVIYNGSTAVYTSSSVSTGSGEWNISFDNGNINMYTSYSIQITYTTSSGTYTATIDSSSTYGSGTYYSASGDCAYKLYNYLYGTNYSNNSELQSAGIKEVDISGMSIYLVAAILCNGSSVSYNSLTRTDGLDFCLPLATLKKLSANWDFEVQKTFESSAMTAGQFEFTLSSATVSDDVWTIGSTLQTKTNSTANQGSDGNSTDTISFTQITYSTDDANKTFYYIVKETTGSETGITYDSTVYGVKVDVTSSSSTSGSTTTTTTTVTATYYKLKWDSNFNGYVVDGQAITLSTNSDGLSIFPFSNSYASSVDFTILKVDSVNNSTALSGAVFTLTATNDGETVYYNADGTSSEREVKLTSGTDGKISVTGLKDGTYTLTEVTAPDGYNLLSNSITITVSGGTVTATYNEENIVTTDNNENFTLTVKNTAGFELPSTGGTGTWLFTLFGLLLCGGAMWLIGLRRRVI